MENASKALIIAGAILVSILLISIGVLIINSTGDMTDQVGTTADTMAIETFNSQFTNYDGNTVSAANVKALISKVKASNATNDATAASGSTPASEKYVEIVWTSPLSSAADLKTTKKYKVKLDYAADTGYVNKVTISE